MAKETNPRARALDAISGKIAVFVVGMYSDERDARRLLEDAVAKIDAAKDLIKASDAANNARPR